MSLLYMLFEKTIVAEKVAAAVMAIRAMQIPNETFLFKGRTSKTIRSHSEE